MKRPGKKLELVCSPGESSSLGRTPACARAQGSAPLASDPEAGYLLVAVVGMVALVLVALSVAAPVIARQIRRDKELESEHRMQQYVRAVRLYYRKNGSYPGSMDALKSTNNIRYLRKDYVDPLTGQANYKLLHLGEQKTTIKVFFGQEIAGIGGSGAGGGLGSASSLSSSTSSTSTIGSTSALASGFSGASLTSGTSTGSSSLTSSSGSSVGGGPIIGVMTSKTGASILTPNGQKDYGQWEFWYDPRIEQYYQKGRSNMGIGGGSAPGTPASGLGTGTGSAFGSGSGATGAGSTSGFGSSSFGNSSFGSSGASGSTGSTGTSGATGSTGSTTSTPQ